MVRPFIFTLIKEFIKWHNTSGFDNLISDTKFLLLSALGIFLPKEYGSFNTF